MSATWRHFYFKDKRLLRTVGFVPPGSRCVSVGKMEIEVESFRKGAQSVKSYTVILDESDSFEIESPSRDAPIQGSGNTIRAAIGEIRIKILAKKNPNILKAHKRLKQ